jgi:hypothetical protein
MICGAGFALMCWREAQRRAYGVTGFPLERECVYGGMPEGEFYRMLDRARMGWAAMNAAKKLGMLGADFRTVL